MVAFLAALAVAPAAAGGHRIGGYGGTLTHASDFDGQFCTMWGLVGALVIDDFAVGAFGIASPRTTRTHEIGDLNLYYGGLYFGYRLPTAGRFGARASVLVGFGSVWRITAPVLEQAYEGTVWTVVPSIDGLFAPSRFFRIALGAGWRIPLGSPVDPSRLSSWIVSLGFEFGSFGNFGR